MEFQAILLAGGEGERLYPLNRGTPKAMLPIANEPMIYYPLTYLEKNGFKQVIIVVQKQQAKQVDHYVKEIYKGKIIATIEVIEEDTDSLHALLKIRNKIKVCVNKLTNVLTIFS